MSWFCCCPRSVAGVYGRVREISAFADGRGTKPLRRCDMARQKRVSMVQPLLLSISDVAIQLGVCRQTVYTFIYREKLPSIKVRGIRRVHPDSLYSWLREREQQSA